MKKTFRLVWRFDDGSEIEQPLAEHERQLQRQYHDMARSDDPHLRRAGQRALDEIASITAAKRAEPVQASLNASKPRPGRAKPVKQRVLAMMARYKAGGANFKAFLRAWEADEIDGLRLEQRSPTEYKVDDENELDATAEYSLSTIQKLYSQA